MDLRFLSSNVHKISEATAILGLAGVNIIASKAKVEELQTADTKRLVTHKALSAFRMLGRPVFVEHTGLRIATLKELPGGLTQVFWDALEADAFAEAFGQSGSNKVVAVTNIGYVDGRNIHHFSGEIHGTIPATPRGNRDFQWDCVFVPDGYSQTFAELGPKKNEISMRRIALDRFAEFLNSNS